jgi:hypothetical protein
MTEVTEFLAIRTTPNWTWTPDSLHLHHFDVSCGKCQQTYGAWGPPPELDENIRQDRENLLRQFLANVCPFHKDSFPISVGEDRLSHP